MMRRTYADMVARGKAHHGDRFSEAGLSAQFVPYYESGARIRVRTSYGETMTGTVSASTGWQPCFLLMRRSNAHGSSVTLDDRDTIEAVQRGRDYRPIGGR